MNQQHMVRGHIAMLATTITVANSAAATFGEVPVGFGLVVPAGTFFAAFAFVLRDLIHQAGGTRAVAVAIVLGTAVSFGIGLAIGSPVPGVSAVQIAVASGAAFALSETADWLMYTPLRERSLWAAMLASNTVGAAVDTWLFLTWSGFGFTWAAFWGQALVKALLVSPIAVGVLALIERRRGTPDAVLR